MTRDEPATQLTRMLRKAASGDREASEALLPLIYQELRSLARARLSREPVGHTLQATALVHEAWVKLGGHAMPSFEDRSQFFAAAARAMRNILVDQARAKARDKRAGGRQRDELSVSLAADEGPSQLDILALDESLAKLEQEHERPARVVMLRYFAGLSLEEIGAVVGVSTRTIDREWRFARSWLRRALGDGITTTPDAGMTRLPRGPAGKG